MDPVKFLDGVKQKAIAEQNAPNEDRLFIREQFKTLAQSMAIAVDEMQKFLDKPRSTSVDNFPSEFKTPDVSEVTKAVKGLEKALKPVKQDNSDIVKAVKGLKLNPTYKPEIKVSPTPVNVAAPNVKVDAPDLKPIEKAIKDNKPEKVDFKDVLKGLKDVKKTITELKFPVSSTPTDPLIKYAEADIDDVDGTGTLLTVRYYGYTDNSGAWYIKKMDTSGAGTVGKTIRFSFGQLNYASAWAGRAGLTYTIWGS